MGVAQKLDSAHCDIFLIFHVHIAQQEVSHLYIVHFVHIMSCIKNFKYSSYRVPQILTRLVQDIQDAKLRRNF